MADNTVKMIFQAVVTQATGQIDKLKASLENLNKSGIGQVVKGLTGFNLSTLASAEMVVQVGKAISKTITDWSEYAEQMDKSAKLSGVSVEEMSRLTQAADDFRVSQDALKTAMGMALKNGFTPNIENLAKLSDEFIAIKDPADRAALASKIFGRGWQEIAPLLLGGGDAIRAGTDAIADNLIVTEDAVKANNEYIRAMDDLGDAWTGVKNDAAQTIIPALTDIINALNGNTNAASIAGGFSDGRSIIARTFNDIEESGADLVPVGQDVNEMLHEMGPAGDDSAGSVQGVADATNNADAAMRKYSEALLFSIASQDLPADAALELARQMGLVDEKTVFATEAVNAYKEKLDSGAISQQEYNDLVGNLADKIAQLEDKHITVTTTFVDEYIRTSSRGDSGGYGGSRDEEYATGGQFVIPPGYEDHSWPVGPGKWARSGETVTITPGAQAAGRNVTYNIFTSDKPGQIQNALRISELLGGAA